MRRFRATCLLLPLLALGVHAAGNSAIQTFAVATAPEASGIVYHPQRGTLFIVNDEGLLFEFSLTGNLLRSKQLARGDFEGITCHPSTGLLYIVNEENYTIYEIDPESLFVRRSFEIQLDFQGKPAVRAGGDGLEGLTFVPDGTHPEGGTFFVSNQAWVLNEPDNPSALLEIEAPLRSAYAERQVAHIVAVHPLPLTDLSGLAYMADTDELLVISDDNDALLRVTRQGEVRRHYPLPGQHQEGIAVDANGTLYIAQDSGGFVRLQVSLSDAAPKAAAVGIATPAASEPVGPTIDIHQAIALALAHSDDIAELDLAVRIAEEEQAAVRDIDDPELRASYGEDRSDHREVGLPDRRETTESMSVGLRFFPPNPIVGSYTARAAAARLQATRDERDDAIRQLYAEIRSLFVELDYLRQDRDLLNGLTTVYKATLTRAEDLKAQGQVTLQDMATVMRRYLAIIDENDKATRDYDDARRRLARLILVPESDLAIEIERDFDQAANWLLHSADALTPVARRYRPDMAALRARLDLTEATLGEARLASVPWLNHVQVSYDESAPDEPAGVSIDESGWTIQAAVSVPFFSPFSHDNKVLAIQRDFAQQKLVTAETRLRENLQDALEEIRHLRDRRDAYEAESRPLLDEITQLLPAEDEADGLASLLAMPPDDIARLREQLFESERLRLETTYRFRLAVIRLESLLGASESLRPRLIEFREVGRLGPDGR
ncbi:MAG: SdiA-regulated domain-containing protein [Verrucomicrobia bacterium]|nr:SdiA-regulated domain-containing protein [Verrucomicrobiota bacterium]